MVITTNHYKGNKMESRYGTKQQNIKITGRMNLFIKKCLKGLHKTFWGATKKCENENLT